MLTTSPLSTNDVTAIDDATGDSPELRRVDDVLMGLLRQAGFILLVVPDREEGDQRGYSLVPAFYCQVKGGFLLRAGSKRYHYQIHSSTYAPGRFRGAARSFVFTSNEEESVEALVVRGARPLVEFPPIKSTGWVTRTGDVIGLGRSVADGVEVVRWSPGQEAKVVTVIPLADEAALHVLAERERWMRGDLFGDPVSVLRQVIDDLLKGVNPKAASDMACAALIQLSRADEAGAR